MPKSIVIVLMSYKMTIRWLNHILLFKMGGIHHHTANAWYQRRLCTPTKQKVLILFATSLKLHSTMLIVLGL
jgi:preprotein translocase subunit Sec63